MLAGWINRNQQRVIAYQREETEVLREMLGGKRLRITDGQGRRLALEAKALSRGNIAAMDFFKVEVMTLTGAVRCSVA